MGNGLHESLSHSPNLALDLCCGLCHGILLCHGIHHGHCIGLGHGPDLSMSRYFYV
jgi:hypothetical protein